MPLPGYKNLLEDLTDELPIGGQQEGVEVVLEVADPAKVDQIPHAGALQRRQPVEVGDLQPLQHVIAGDVAGEAFLASLTEVADVVLVRRPEEWKAVGEEFRGRYAPVEVAEERGAGGGGHIGDVHGGELLLPEVMGEHAAEDRRPGGKNGAVGADAAVACVDGDVGIDGVGEHPPQGGESGFRRRFRSVIAGPDGAKLAAALQIGVTHKRWSLFYR